MNKIRMFVVKNNEDAQAMNDFLERLEDNNIGYEYHYDFTENEIGIVVTINFE